ncbi:MAG: hypothetical protein Q4Q07_02040 [Tissierellia bacterium]|nr:hypothetical protein [Tissierellia bacterium]
MVERDVWQKILFILSLVLLFVSLVYFAYSYSNKVNVYGLKNEEDHLEKEIRTLTLQEKEHQVKIKEETENLNIGLKRFEEKYGFSSDTLDHISFEKEMEVYEKEQEDILKEMVKILENTSPYYLGSDYDNEIVDEFLSKYLELSSRSDLEKKKDSLFEELKINEVYPLIAKTNMYRDFFLNFSHKEEERKFIIAHVYSLTYPIYEILHGNRSKSNPEEMYLHYKILVDRMESLNKQFGIRTSIEPLLNGRDQMTYLFYKYREYDGVLSELERLEQKEGKNDVQEK